MRGTVSATSFIGDGSALTGIPATGWTLGVSNVGISTTNNVGIGTNITTNAGLSVMGGSVGIGTWVPSAPLNVKGNVTFSGGTTTIGGLSISSGGTLTNISNVSNASLGSSGLTFNNSGSSSISNSNTSGTGMSITAGSLGSSNRMLFATGPLTQNGDFINFQVGNVGIGTITAALRIQSGGNIGLGTSNPLNRLAVIGNIGVGTTAGDAYLTTSAPLGGGIFYGNIGIGSNNPTQKLDVNGTVKATAFVGDGSALTGISTISGLTTNKITKAASSTTIADSQIFDNGTNVGIGSLLPVQKLDVAGTISATAFIGLGSGDSTFTDGNVGIGSATPGTQLDVVGTMRMIGTGPGAFRVQTGTDTACTTTCTTGKALFGFNDGVLGVSLPHLVGPSDATADECLCGS